jgi:hypothetical protein
MVKRGKLKIGLLYLSLHNQLVRKVGFDRIISRKDFFCIIGKHFLIPKNVKPIIIKEMEELDLIKRENKESIKVLKSDINFLEDAHDFYQKIYKENEK